MSKLSKRALISVFTLVLTFVALGATTFAWFSLGSTATVDPFSAQVRGATGLEVMFGVHTDEDNENGWYSTINVDTMKNYIGDLLNEEFKYGAVSTTDGLNFYELAEITSKTEEETVGIVNNKKVDNPNTEYVEFNLSFRTTESSKEELYLSKLNIASDGHGDWRTDIEKFQSEFGEKKKDELVSTKASWAARVGISELDSEESLVYKSGETEEENIDFDLTNGAHNYVALKNGFETIEPEEDFDIQTYMGTHKSAHNLNDGDDNELVGSFGNRDETTGYHYLVLTVRVWLEGWDGNAYDAIFDQFLNVGFEFSLEDK